MSIRDHQVEEIFAAALELSEGAVRDLYVASACAGNDVLRREVGTLLAALQMAGRFLEEARTVPEPAWQAASPGVFQAEKPGERIGRYRLVEPIGEGGMGSVWLAEQEEPVRRRVALKVIKLGMDTREVVARFEAERQALALMDHPHIAKVFDAGSTERPFNSTLAPEQGRAAATLSAGRPYFVMELVRGVPITKYCDQGQLSSRERLDLFKQVCEAVQHAHQKGIIHRDLKPSNILVTLGEGSAPAGCPKVIDFGIAKATGQSLTDKTLFTRFANILGTPAYMSPEQAELTSNDIDTRSDIYSLGVLLYELLTGRTPFDGHELLRAGLDEMRRVIRETEPPRPSTKLSAFSPAELLATAQRFRTDPTRLLASVRGDLDWIVMKCLEKDRARRYQTANDLAADLQRHLSSEPVGARPPSALYRWHKFTRKHRTAVAVGASFALVLTLATVSSTALAVWANGQRARAEHATQQEREARLREENQRKAAQVAEARATQSESEAKAKARSARDAAADALAVLGFFQNKVLAAPRPQGQDGGLGLDITIRAALDAAEPELAQSFTNSPLVEAEIRGTLGMTYYHLGDTDKAIEQSERALALRRKLGDPERHVILESLNNLGTTYLAAGKSEQALSVFLELVELCRSKYGTNHFMTIYALEHLATAYHKLGQLTEALPLAEEAVLLGRSNFGARDHATLSSLNHLASIYAEVGRMPDAMALMEEAFEGLKDTRGLEHPDSLRVMNNLGTFYQRTGRTEQALRLFREAWRVQKAKLGEDHLSTLLTMANLAKVYQQAGQLGQAIELFEQNVRLARSRYGADDTSTVRAMSYLASAYLADDRSSAALELYPQVLEHRRQHRGPHHPETLAALSDFASACYQAGQTQKATELFEELVPLLRASAGSERPDTLQAITGLAASYQAAHRFVDASKLLQEVLSVQRKTLPSDSLTLAETLGLLGETLVQENPAEAASLLREALGVFQKRQPERGPVFKTQSLLGWAVFKQGNNTEAEPLLLQAYQGLERRAAARTSRAQAQVLQETVERIVQLYQACGKTAQAEQWRQKLR